MMVNLAILKKNYFFNKTTAKNIVIFRDHIIGREKKIVSKSVPLFKKCSKKKNIILIKEIANKI